VITKRTLENQAADRLVKWLNSKLSRRHPVTKILVSFRTLIWRARQEADRGGPFDDFADFVEEIKELTREFPFVLQVDWMTAASPDRVNFRLESFRRGQRYVDGCGVLNDILTLAQSGKLWKVTRCWFVGCKLAFNARRSVDHFCSARCRRKSERSQAKERQSRSIDARILYWRGPSDTQKREVEVKWKRKQERELALGDLEQFLRRSERRKYWSEFWEKLEKYRPRPSARGREG
jgi:hypothetical protein